jgi:hypothetical protein
MTARIDPILAGIPERGPAGFSQPLALEGTADYSGVRATSGEIKPLVRASLLR